MAAPNIYDDPKLGASPNPYDDPNLGAPTSSGLLATAFKAPLSTVAGWASKLGLVGTLPFQAADAVRGMVSGKPETGAQDWAFSHLVDPAVHAQEALSLSPTDQASTAHQIVQGLGATIPDLAAAVGTGNLVGGIKAAGTLANVGRGLIAMGAIPGLSSGVGEAMHAVREGVDLPTAYASGATGWGTTALMGAVPMAMQGGNLTRAVTGMASGVGTGEISRQAQNAVLSDYPHMQQEFTGQGATVNAVIGGLMGVVLGHGKPVQEKLNTAKAEVSAELDRTDPTKPAAPPEVMKTPLRLDYTRTLQNEPLRVFPDGTVVRSESDAVTYANKSRPADATEPTDAELRTRMAATLPDGEVPAAPRVVGQDGLHQAAIDRIYDAGETPTGTPQTDRKRAMQLDQGLPPTPTEGHVPTAIELAMLDAQSAKAKIDAKAVSGDAQDMRNTAGMTAEQSAALINLTRGQATLEAAQNGTLTTPELRRPADYFAGLMDTVIPEEMRVTAGGKKSGTPATIQSELAQAIKGHETLPEQIAAVGEKVAALSKNTGTLRYEVFKSLHDKLLQEHPDETTPPSEAPKALEAAKAPEAVAEPRAAEPAAVKPFDGLPTAEQIAAERAAVKPFDGLPTAEQIAAERGAVDPTPLPALTEFTGRNVLNDPNRPAVMAAVDAAKAKLTALGEEYKARMDAHEVLSETGRDRYRYAADVLGTLVKDTATGKAASSERLLSSVHDSNDFLTPQSWAKKAGEWRNNVANGISDAPSPELAALLKTTNKVPDLMDHYIANGSTDEKALAKIIKKFNLTTTVDVGAMPSGFRPNSVGGFDSVSNRIRLLDSGVTAHTLFHEVLHAVSNDALERAEAISTPKNQTEAKIKQAYAEFDGVRREALQQGNAKEHYGLTDAHEFLSELNTNAGFREFLSGIKSGKTTLWDRAVDAIRKMLGMDPKATTLLDKAMKTQDAFFNKEAHDEAQRLIREKQEFDESPAGAAKVTDSTLRSLVKSADKHEDDVLRGVPSAIERGIASALHTGHQAKLSIQTTQFIAKILGYAAERMPTLKPLVGHVEAFRGAWDQGKLVSHMLATYGDNATIPLDRQLKALSSAKAKEVNFTMGRLGTNSSIGGYYPHLNYADNLKRLPDLDPKLARHINAEYEIFKQLNRDYPAAANALLEGSKVYLNQYQHTTAATTFNLLKLAEGRAERAAEAMVGMAADDPGLPALAARVDGASAEMALVAQAAGIDIGSNEVRHGALVDGKWQGHRNGDTTKFLDGTSFVLGKRLDAIFKQAETLPEGSVLRDQLKAIGDTYAAQTTTPYYPAGRIGEHFASIGWKDMDDATWAKMGKAMEGSGKVLGDYQGQDHAMMTFNTASEAAGMRSRLEAAMGDKADISKSLSGLRAAYIGNDLAGLSTGLRAVLDTLHDNITSLGLAPEQALAMKDQLTRTILSLTPETSGKSAKIARQGIPGADGDYLGVMARTSMASAHDTAGIYAAPLFAQASRGMDAALRTLALDPDIKVQEYGRSVVTEMLKRHENSMKPASTSLAPLINAIGYAWTMAVNLGQVIRNGSGIAIQSLPRLGGTYGYVPAFKALMSTGADAMRIVTGELHRNFAEGGVAGVLNARIDFHKLGLTDRLAHDMQFLQDHGVFDQGQGAVLRDMAQGGSTKMNELHRAVSSFVTYSELYNRLVVGMAASNLAHARQPGMPGDAISAKHQAYAREVIDETLGNFNPTNIGRALGRHGFASEWTPIMTMFTQFNFQAMEQIAAATHAGLFGKDKSEAGLARAKAARKELAGVFGMTTMVAGVMGLPFATAVAGLYNKFNDDPDNPGDIREVVRSALASHFGVGGGDLVAHGLIGGIGMDSSGFGMANLLPGSELLASRRQGKDFLDDASKALIGPAFGMILDGARAWSEFKDGNVVQAITHMMPAAVKGPWKASVMAERGFTDSKGNPIGLTATPWDIASQWLGFRPEPLAMQRELSGYTQTDQNILNHRSGVLTDHIFKAHKFGDAADQEKAMAEWKAFILKNPTQPIADLAAVFRKHAMDEAIGRMTGTGVAVSKRQLPTFMRDSQWANQGGMPAY